MSYGKAQKIKIMINGTKEIISNTGEPLLYSLAAAGELLEASCGGRGTCGICKIKVISGKVVNSHGLPATPEKDGSYLACQVYPVEDLVVEKDEIAGACSKGKLGKILIPTMLRESPVQKHLIKPVYPTLGQNYSLQEMINRSLGSSMVYDSAVLKELASIAQSRVHEITLLSNAERVTWVESGDTTSAMCGVAFDIGSTTVAGMLVDLIKGEIVAAAAETNPQATFGADVISRIKAAGKPEGLAKLSALVRECLNVIIGRLCTSAGITNNDIYVATIVGNSTMEHLLMGISPTHLTLSPYVTVFKELPVQMAKELDLAINPGATAFLLPNIASFVGADTVAAVMAVDQDLNNKHCLLIDLGTNGEIVLGNKDKLLTSSTAAGPAFEGAQLSCGMRATSGAIENLRITDDVYVETINNARPVGICGSGIIKAIAEMLRCGLITPSGRLIESSKTAKLPRRIGERLRDKDGCREFVLVFANHSASGLDIVVTQADIRAIQLVKSSIYTGSQILMENLGITPDEVDEVLIAGAFGNYIDLDSAIAIGMIPVPVANRHKVRSVGNAAGEGAVKCLLSKQYLTRCMSIAKKAEFVELANTAHFQASFIQNLSFPEAKKESA